MWAATHHTALTLRCIRGYGVHAATAAAGTPEPRAVAYGAVRGKVKLKMSQHTVRARANYPLKMWSKVKIAQ
jgi:hypothetical protein